MPLQTSKKKTNATNIIKQPTRKLDYSQGNRQKKEKREDRIKEKFFMGGGGIIMLEKRNYVQID